MAIPLYEWEIPRRLGGTGIYLVSGLSIRLLTCRTHLYSLLAIRLQSNTSPLLFIPPPHPDLPISTQELYTQIAFENLNVPALSILPTPFASQLALNSTTGLIVHVGYTTTRIDVVLDSVVRWESGVTVEVGIRDCESWLQGLLNLDDGVERELRAASGKMEGEGWGVGEKEKLVAELSEAVWGCTADGDIVVRGAVEGGKLLAAAVAVPEEEETFDVAKK
jgi:hypothetical protein